MIAPSRFLVVYAATVGVLIAVHESKAQERPSDVPLEALTEEKPAVPTLDSLVTIAMEKNPDIRVAQAKVHYAEAMLVRTRMEVAQGVISAWNELLSSKEEVALGNEHLDLRFQFYREGKEIVSEVVQTQKDVAELEATYARTQAIFDVLRSKMRDATRVEKTDIKSPPSEEREATMPSLDQVIVESLSWDFDIKLAELNLGQARIELAKTQLRTKRELAICRNELLAVETAMSRALELWRIEKQKESVGVASAADIPLTRQNYEKLRVARSVLVARLTALKGQLDDHLDAKDKKAGP